MKVTFFFTPTKVGFNILTLDMWPMLSKILLKKNQWAKPHYKAKIGQRGKGGLYINTYLEGRRSGELQCVVDNAYAMLFLL